MKFFVLDSGVKLLPFARYYTLKTNKDIIKKVQTDPEEIEAITSEVLSEEGRNLGIFE
jgi:hypothetical protein